ncbi:THAP domain-containing protein 1-like isoform X2 [Agrilus planipennis]|uniref:THAP domain-containing protein 1-like isoform X2 n=1 Tax=Agrilus planipennis TaxID=224129 RepID=A0A7F5QXM6_AGRPL|nr:THAP domain-containing protein 1-like isoform X2 [Agrilus planipennis]
MVQYCFICKWKANKEPRRSFHKFPSGESDKKKWLNIIGKDDVNVGKRASVCSIHFKKSCFRYGLVNNREMLKPKSVPSLYLVKTTEIVKDDLPCTESSLQDCIDVDYNDVAANTRLNENVSVIPERDTSTSFIDKKEVSDDITCTVDVAAYRKIKNQLMQEKRKNFNLKRMVSRMRQRKDLLKKQNIALRKKSEDKCIENKLLHVSIAIAGKLKSRKSKK